MPIGQMRLQPRLLVYQIDENIQIMANGDIQPLSIPFGPLTKTE